MRYVNIALGVLMIVFVAVQYNDPDPHVWMPIYGIAAAWALGAAFRLPRFSAAPMQALLAASVFAYIVLTVYYWPKSPGFWHQEVWWNEEEAREGMGMMTALAVLLFVSFAAFRARSRRS